MPTKIYDTNEISLVNGTKLFVTPLKIFYLRQFMDKFEQIDSPDNQDDRLGHLAKCCLIAMKQYYPSITTVEELEDSLDMDNMYSLIEYCSGIKMNGQSEEENKSSDSESTSWKDLDLAKLESELFLLGIWKDYRELEESLSLPELFKTLESKRDAEYNDKKFAAAMQGVDLEENKQEEDPWEAMKARVAAQTSGMGNGDPNDITAFQGVKAAQAGFGIGMGLEYETVTG